MAKKYLRNRNGIVSAITTDNLQLEKPLLNENYDIEVHNRNMDKIDEDLKPIDDSYIIELFKHDGDTANPRDYYTKVEADEKFATKEEVENIDLSNLATKEEANNALNKANEALQVGSNVKQNLVDKLTSEGLNVSTDNTFEELINNIALGKKWASGQVSPTGDYTNKLHFIEENIKFDFNPSIFIAYLANRTYSNVNPFSLFIKDVYAFTSTSSDVLKVFTNSDMYNNGMYIDNTGFKVIVYNYSSLTNASQYIFNWIAIE